MITDAFRKLCFRETNKLSRDEINNLRNYINTILVPYLIKIHHKDFIMTYAAVYSSAVVATLKWLSIS